MESRQELQKYYSEIYPSKELFDILEIDEKREITFFTHQQSYCRFLTFSTHSEFHKKILEINPMKIDIGAIYDIRPAKMNGAVPVARELIFDIDLTDYPRECCKDKTICKECYEKIKCAVKLLDYSLRKELGFKEIGFVFSGRRGVHCWVFDGKYLDTAVRNDIFKFYQQIIDKNLFVKAYHDIMSEFSSDEKELIKNWFIRIDKQVTVTTNHLIKSPFSIHPDTGRVSVPLDPNNLIELDDIPDINKIIKDPSLMDPFIEIMNGWRRGK